MQQRKIKFLDTTLRDGEQTPGVNLNLQDKLRLARELDDMRIDVIEAALPVRPREILKRFPP